MILYIAEKPSLARAVVEVLPKPHKKCDGYIEAANGDVVSWCIGHLLEQAEPDVYDASYKKWKVEDLPILPRKWKLVPKPKTKRQLSILKRLIKKADQLVHTGDPDREGQVLIDEVINYCGVPTRKKNSVKRCLISDLNPASVKKSLASLQDNKNFIPLSVSALARSRADWLYGLNMTRMCTLQGRSSGFDGVLSVGRVQTPLLGLVVKRDKEVEDFSPRPYYEVFATLDGEKGAIFKAKWKPSEACEPYQDEDGRVLSKKLAENVVSRISGKNGLVLNVTKTRKSQNPPLPYNLSSLQIDAAKCYGMNAKRVLDVCQKLYETHKLITYPRSDCRYLPEEHFNEVGEVVSAMSKAGVISAEEIDASDYSIKGKAWNDKKITAHHAIIPTAKGADASRLSKDEINIYRLVSRQYLCQFYPPFSYADKKVDIEIASGLFLAKEREIIDLGWKKLLGTDRKDQDNSKESSGKKLPDLTEGDVLFCREASCVEKLTTPPKYFTDATLLAAMTGVAKFVKDPEIKKVLRETDGLGTEATRAGIIELLFKRGFLIRRGKVIKSTSVGRQLINSLPSSMTVPDMTAQWESHLESITKREMTYDAFMGPMIATLHNLIKQVEQSSFAAD